VKYLRAQEIEKQCWFANMIGESKGMHEIFKMVRHIGRLKIDRLNHGRKRDGKELISRAIHFHSSRKDHPFVTINCAAIPETLIESELFGYEKGALRMPWRKKLGRFEVAHLGTLFLDEIGETELGHPGKNSSVPRRKRIYSGGRIQNDEGRCQARRGDQ